MQKEKKKLNRCHRTIPASAYVKIKYLKTKNVMSDNNDECQTKIFFFKISKRVAEYLGYNAKIN